MASIKPNSAHPPTIIHSCQFNEQLVPGTMYNNAINPDIKTAKQPINLPFLTLNGRDIFGFNFRRRRKDIATIQYARQHAKFAESTIQTNITRPKNGAIMERTPRNKIDTQGVLYLGCSLEKIFGSILALDME